MAGGKTSSPAPVFEIEGRRYVVLPESEYFRLLEAASGAAGDGGWAAWAQDAERLSERLVERRRAAGLSQAELARAAGLRVETLNRIERGHNSPDFSTIRKLLLALRHVGGAAPATSRRRPKEAR